MGLRVTGIKVIDQPSRTRTLMRISKRYHAPMLTAYWHGASYLCVPTEGFIAFGVYPKSPYPSLAAHASPHHWHFFQDALAEYPVFLAQTRLSALLKMQPAFPRVGGYVFTNTFWDALKEIARYTDRDNEVNVFVAQKGKGLLLQVFYRTQHGIFLLIRPLLTLDLRKDGSKPYMPNEIHERPPAPIKRRPGRPRRQYPNPILHAV